MPRRVKGEREDKPAIWTGENFIGRCSSHGAALCSLVLSPDSTCVNSIHTANFPLPFIRLVVKTRAVKRWSWARDIVTDAVVDCRNDTAPPTSVSSYLTSVSTSYLARPRMSLPDIRRRHCAFRTVFLLVLSPYWSQAGERARAIACLVAYCHFT